MADLRAVNPSTATATQVLDIELSADAKDAGVPPGATTVREHHVTIGVATEKGLFLLQQVFLDRCVAGGEV
jgi:hypothetical protein